MSRPAAPTPADEAAPDATDATEGARRTEEVWRALGDQLRSYIRRRVRDPATTEDLLQETFLRVHRSVGTLRDDERVGAWVFRIARNVIVDHARRRHPSESLTPDEVASPPGDGSDGVDDNLNAEVAGWLRPMMETLPEEYRDALELSELGGVSQRELADQLGLSASGARTRVQRGRARLRDVVRECCEVELDRRGNVIDYEPRGCC